MGTAVGRRKTIKKNQLNINLLQSKRQIETRTHEAQPK